MFGWAGALAGRAPGVLPAALAPRHAARVLLRRDLLRQGRVVAAPPRLRARLRRGRRQDDPQRQPDRAVPDGPSMIVHPEVGKWVIAAGIKVFGMDPTGWRTASAVVGALMVLLMCRFARRVTGSTVLGLVAGLLLSVDGLQLVLSRLALLDIFLAFFTLCGVHCVVADRSGCADRLAAGGDPGGRTWWRPWLVLGGSASASRAAPSGPVSTRWRSSACSRGCGAPAHGGRSASPGRCSARSSSTGRRRSSRWWASRWRLRRVVDGLAGARRRLRGRVQQHPVHVVRRREAVADRERARRRRPRGGHPVAAVAVVLPPGRLHLPQPLPQRLDPRLRLQAVDVAGDGSPGRRRRPDRHPARLAGVRGALGLSCIRQVLLLGNPVIWWGGSLAAIASLLLWVGAPRLAPRRRGRRPRQHVAALVRLRRPADLLLLRDHRPAVPRAVGRAGAWGT